MFKRRSILVNGIICTIVVILCLFCQNYIINNIENPKLDKFIDSLALIIIISGLYLRISARGYKSENHHTKTRLIETGPFSIIRNPMYFGTFLIGLGVVLMILNWWMLIIYTIFFAIWYWPQIHLEQNHLKEKFGIDYLNYCKATPCFFPKFSNLKISKIHKNIPMKTKWIKKELKIIIIWLTLVLTAEIFADTHNFLLYDIISESMILFFIILTTIMITISNSFVQK